MNTATKIKVAERQIQELQAAKAALADRWLEMGYEKCSEACAALTDQIVALYEEIDALNEGTTTLPAWEAPSDEIGVSKMELAAVAHLGWDAERLVRFKRTGR